MSSAAPSYEFVWVKCRPRHAYEDEVLQSWSDDGWEVINWSARQGWFFFGLLPPSTWVLLRKPR